MQIAINISLNFLWNEIFLSLSRKSFWNTSRTDYNTQSQIAMFIIKLDINKHRQDDGQPIFVIENNPIERRNGVLFPSQRSEQRAVDRKRKCWEEEVEANDAFLSGRLPPPSLSLSFNEVVHPVLSECKWCEMMSKRWHLTRAGETLIEDSQAQSGPPPSICFAPISTQSQHTRGLNINGGYANLSERGEEKRRGMRINKGGKFSPLFRLEQRQAITFIIFNHEILPPTIARHEASRARPRGVRN